ncbi:diguanylate cyclase [Herbaspirillum sp. ST 5-3]|uniref:sensor domain-containing diguanylate cyclase n=1 Tax=Oxalobacteraceae TaxID=75682 RepID=UPI0010A516C1|nr:diguanylate cyclase [Herbaspirillum sp. ST 5-3]
MKLLTGAFSDLGELHALLGQADLLTSVRAAKSVLVQVYNRDEDIQWITEIMDALRALREDIVVVGASTFGHISRGQVCDARSVVSLSCFDTAELVLIEQDCHAGEEADAATRLVDALGDRIASIKGVLLLATPLAFNCDLLLASINTASPGLPVFGGGSADISLKRMLVFSRHRMIHAGFVAVALCGGTLEISRAVHLGWQPIGRKLTITQAQGSVVSMIDHKPAIDIYKRYLGIDSGDNFFLNVMEFPLLVERHGELHARVPYQVRKDGSILFTAELQEGEEVHFGYARIESMKQRVQALEKEVRAFGPEAIHIYSCIMRHFVLQRDIDLELLPFERLAPTAGFITAGEFCSRPDAAGLRNAAMVVVAMRESPAPGKAMHAKSAPADESRNLYEDNHMRILLRYQHFVQAITEDLENANAELARLAERDPLTGLFNRRALNGVMQNELERSRRYGKSFSIIVCDIDHFKRFNDVYGHQAGDTVLKELAIELQAEARASDVVCRFGGEEFVIVMPETRAEDAAEFAERVRRAVEALRLFHQDAPLPPTTISFGVADFPGNGANADELVSAADAALYDAKRQGRNRVCRSTRTADEKK